MVFDLFTSYLKSKWGKSIADYEDYIKRHITKPWGQTDT